MLPELQQHSDTRVSSRTPRQSAKEWREVTASTNKQAFYKMSHQSFAARIQFRISEMYDNIDMFADSFIIGKKCIHWQDKIQRQIYDQIPQ